MKAKILSWLKEDRSFDTGVALYNKFGQKQSFKHVLNRQGDTPFNHQCLIEELRQLAEIKPDQLKSILAKPVSKYELAPVPESDPAETPLEDEVPVLDEDSENVDPEQEDVLSETELEAEEVAQDVQPATDAVIEDPQVTAEEAVEDVQPATDAVVEDPQITEDSEDKKKAMEASSQPKTGSKGTSNSGKNSPS